MEPMIPDGSYCIFRRTPQGTRNGRIVFVWSATFARPALAVGERRSAAEAQERSPFQESSSGWPRETSPRQAPDRLRPAIIVYAFLLGGVEIPRVDPRRHSPP